MFFYIHEFDYSRLNWVYEFADFFWLTARTELVLHPDNPIRTSDSVGIQATFAGLFVLVGLAAALLVWRGVKREKIEESK